MGKPVTITLTVNASSLFNANPQPKNETELVTYCGLSDNNCGQIPPGKTTLNNFLSQVYNSNTVTWVGDNGGSNGYRVLITGITNNPSFFASEPNGNSGRVTTTLKDDVAGIDDTYTISFSVDPPGNGDPKKYTIDPKLRGNN